MPPKAKITKEMILRAVLALTREQGFDSVNARSIADRLQCSTRPIFTCYENMEGMKKEFLAFAYHYYEQYTENYQKTADVPPLLLLPLSYVAFAREETNLFQLLFVQDMDLNMAGSEDFYREPDNERRALEFAKLSGLRPERAGIVFLNLFLYTHGIAVLTASGKLSLEKETIESMTAHVLSAFLKQEGANE